jgi:hypothetical protein
MKKITFALALALLAVFAFGNADAVQRRYEAQVYKIDTNKGPIENQLTSANQRLTGIQYAVYAVGTATLETLYARIGPTGQAVTAKTNPVTATVFAAEGGTDNGRISFVCDPTDATYDRYVDLLVVDTVGGYTAFIKNFDPSTRTITIDETRNKLHRGTVWFGGTTSEASTGVTFGQNTFIHDVQVEVVTAAAASTLHVGLLSSGTTGLATGFRSNVLLTNTGNVIDTGVVSSSNSVDFNQVTTYGTLLYTAVTGSATYASSTAKIAVGGRSYIGHMIRGTQTGVLTYTAGATVAKGFLHYQFTPVR